MIFLNRHQSEGMPQAKLNDENSTKPRILLNGKYILHILTKSGIHAIVIKDEKERKCCTPLYQVADASEPIEYHAHDLAA